MAAGLHRRNGLRDGPIEAVRFARCHFSSGGGTGESDGG
jgi:hypothetical protein